jgi:2-isopropylmalate synthase
MKERIFLYDTTLRDGAQTSGVDFNVEDKIRIARLLDEFGFDYVEGGYPGANPTDSRVFETRRTKRAKFTAFGMTKRAGISVSNDPGLAAVLGAAADACCFVAKSWEYHVRLALGITPEENLESVRLTVAAALAAGREVLVDCEHFFDGFKDDPAHALAVAEAAHAAGARWVVLCDTNGGTLPHEIERIVGEVVRVVPGDRLGIHAHDDTGQAVANSLAAVRAGVRQVQGTLNGIGERCGNADLVTIIGTLALKSEFSDRFETGISADDLVGLTRLSRSFDDILNRSPNRHAPYVGANAFATKAGIHASAIVKDPRTYEHVAPESIGNRRRVLVSDQAGKSNLLSELARFGIAVDRADPRLDRLLAEVKEREARGFSYEAADASLELLARRTLGSVPRFFDVQSFRVMVERRFNEYGELVTQSEATVKVKIGDLVVMSAAEGNGPVNALDAALRKDLGPYQSVIDDLELTDFKVRILNGGTGATTRVLIESRDGAGNLWTTIGVSENIVDASFQALMDAVVYRLVKSGIAAVV